MELVPLWETPICGRLGAGRPACRTGEERSAAHEPPVFCGRCRTGSPAGSEGTERGQGPCDGGGDGGFRDPAAWGRAGAAVGVAGRARPAATRPHEVPWELGDCAEERGLVTVQKTPVPRRGAWSPSRRLLWPRTDVRAAQMRPCAVLVCHVVLLACSALGVPSPLTRTPRGPCSPHRDEEAGSEQRLDLPRRST